ncbi:ATP-binding protein, partial [Hyphobacterium sp. SN044]|uniref:ATP-binding protein n=1 Tax=Hyphobacterium sp. SN044 TaxID=2912575 RepID=UPI001F1D4DA5
EALTNAVRHADATSITLELRSSPDHIEFVITDNGKGFEQAEESAEHGLGLGLMQERVQELGGMLSIHSTLGEGTHIAISVPQENIL